MNRILWSIQADFMVVDGSGGSIMVWGRSLLPIRFLLSAAMALACAVVPAAAQSQEGTLTVAGDVSSPLKISPADLKTMPRTSVTVMAEGRETRYEGVLVGELLKRAGAPLGRELSGGALATYVVASASDGYQAVFSLAELDPAFTSNDIIIADTTDGKPLLENQGPLRIVAPHDKRLARSVRMLQRLEIVRLRK
jgi:DMSO/TMAO reductase YedYZ molybdopterin-dependent catalytic subunit